MSRALRWVLKVSRVKFAYDMCEVPGKDQKAPLTIQTRDRKAVVAYNVCLPFF